MSLATSRAVLRHSKFAVRRAGVRNASSTTEAAKEKAGQAASKASEGLSRVSSSAGEAANKVGSSASDAATKVQGTTGGMIGRVQGMIPRVTHYSRVGLELGKLVTHQRAMAPPNVSTVQGYFQPVISGLRHPVSLLNRASETSTTQIINTLSQVRNASSTQWLSAGVVAAEIIGFFTVGEMVGRFKLVGYHSSAPAHH